MEALAQILIRLGHAVYWTGVALAALALVTAVAWDEVTVQGEVILLVFAALSWAFGWLVRYVLAGVCRPW